MTDVEYILEANHRRARERELGERWDKIIRQRKRKSELLKASEAFCFWAARRSCWASGCSRRRSRSAARR